MNKLGKRLSLVASLVRHGSILADIGTDHAYLPVYLVKKGVVPFAFACDINIGPLQNAKRTILNAGLSKQIETILSDGLKNLKENSANEIVIAGMGGILISEILKDTPWLKSTDIHLILQPMTHAEEARKFLISNGFYIDKEKACSDLNHTYCVISAYFDGKVRKYDTGYIYYGELKGETQDEEKYLNAVYSSILKKYNALKSSGKNEEVSYLKNIIDDFERNRNVNCG